MIQESKETEIKLKIKKFEGKEKKNTSKTRN